MFFKKNKAKDDLSNKEMAEIMRESKEEFLSEKDNLTPQERKVTQQYFDSMKQFEVSKQQTAKLHAKLGYIVGAVGLVCAAAAIFTVSAIMPLKEVKPYIVSVDYDSGQALVISDLNNKNKFTTDKAVISSELVKFVKERESYNWYTIQNQLDYIKDHSLDGIYSNMRESLVNSKYSPLDLFGDKKQIRVAIRSIPIINEKSNNAQVRFCKIVLNTDNTPDGEYTPTCWVASMSFDFEHKLSSDNEKINNPLGFRVTSWQVDEESQK